MNLKELRIGNRVLFRKHTDKTIPLTVQEITPYSVVAEELDIEKVNKFYIHSSKVEGVPITKEFIAENFAELEPNLFRLGECGYLTIIGGEFYALFRDFGGLKKELKHVHELQNIVFAIAGIEICE